MESSPNPYEALSPPAYSDEPLTDSEAHAWCRATQPWLIVLSAGAFLGSLAGLCGVIGTAVSESSNAYLAQFQAQQLPIWLILLSSLVEMVFNAVAGWQLLNVFRAGRNLRLRPSQASFEWLFSREARLWRVIFAWTAYRSVYALTLVFMSV